jgi:hypothetical protein
MHYALVKLLNVKVTDIHKGEMAAKFLCFGATPKGVPHTNIVYLGVLGLVEIMARCNEPTASYIYEPVEFEK